VNIVGKLEVVGHPLRVAGLSTGNPKPATDNRRLATPNHLIQNFNLAL